MTRDDIIRMAHEAGFSDIVKKGVWITDGCWDEELERFAELVAAAERARWKEPTKEMKVKVTVEIDDDAFDLIMVKVLEDRIKECYTETFYHKEDIEWNEKLKEALWIVFDYFAGEEKAKELKNLIEGGEDEI